jgi:D-galactarolactone cycloisomerase
MKITDIKTIRLRASLPSAGQVHSRSGVRASRSALLVKVNTDEGITGIGSCSGNATLIEIIVDRMLKPLLVGMDPTNIEQVWDKAYFRGGVRALGSRGIGVVALSGIDIALWDILGKVKGLPIYQLLGGPRREKVPVYATALYPDLVERVVQKAVSLAEQGFRALKIKVGFDLAQDVAIVGAVRKQLGKDFTIMTDANQGYKIDAAIKAAIAFAELGVTWLEEPLFCEDIEAHARLKRQSQVPIALGENLHTRFAFEAFMARNAVDYLQPDIARAGGISEIMKISELATRYTLPVSLHTWGDGVALAASLHLSTALENSPIMELDTTHNPLRTDILSQPLEFRGGFMIVPQGPGLGVTLDPVAIKKYAFSGAEEIALWKEPVSASV